MYTFRGAGYGTQGLGTGALGGGLGGPLPGAAGPGEFDALIAITLKGYKLIENHYLFIVKHKKIFSTLFMCFILLD